MRLWYFGMPPTIRYVLTMSISLMPGWNWIVSLRDMGFSSMRLMKRPYKGRFTLFISSIIMDTVEPQMITMVSVFVIPTSMNA